jgi:hypothetical protein
MARHRSSWQAIVLTDAMQERAADRTDIILGRRAAAIS